MKKVSIVLLLVALICVSVFANPTFPLSVTAALNFSVNHGKGFVADSFDLVGEYYGEQIISSSADMDARLGYHYALENEPEVSNGAFANVGFYGKLNDRTTLSSGLSVNFIRKETVKTSSIVGVWAGFDYKNDGHDFKGNVEYKYSFANDPEVSGFYFDCSADYDAKEEQEVFDNLNYEVVGSVELHKFDGIFTFTDGVINASSYVSKYLSNSNEGLSFLGKIALQYSFKDDPYETGLFIDGRANKNVFFSTGRYFCGLNTDASFHIIDKKIRVGELDIEGFGQYQEFAKVCYYGGAVCYTFSVDNSAEENGLFVVAGIKESINGENFVQYVESDFHNIDGSLKMNMGVVAYCQDMKLPNNFTFTFGAQYNFVRKAGADAINVAVGSRLENLANEFIYNNDTKQIIKIADPDASPVRLIDYIEWLL